MSSFVKVTKYQLYDFSRSVTIYYGIILLLGALLFTVSRLSDSTGQSSFSGSAVIFIFTLGLNCFKTSFQFMQTNNVSRKRFYLGNSLAIICVAAFMAVINFVLDSIFVAYLPYVGLYQQIYTQTGFFAEFFWSFTLLTLATSMGWLISMIYYRSNAIVKTIVSLSPVVILIVYAYLNRVTHGRLIHSMLHFMSRALGLNTGQTSYSAVLSFTIAATVLLALTYLFVYKAPIKD